MTFWRNDVGFANAIYKNPLYRLLADANNTNKWTIKRIVITSMHTRFDFYFFVHLPSVWQSILASYNLNCITQFLLDCAALRQHIFKTIETSDPYKYFAIECIEMMQSAIFAKYLLYVCKAHCSHVAVFTLLHPGSIEQVLDQSNRHFANYFSQFIYTYI